jgi:tetratricopeptide (TPR) repeat protein
MRSTGEANAIASASRALLAQGDAVGAEQVLKPVFEILRSDASVLHLMGIIKRTLNQMDEAERHLRAAVAYSLNDGQYYNDLGVVLQARGAFAEAMRVYRAAHALMPEAAAVRVNIVHCLLAAGEMNEADREARAFVAIAPGAESWTLLGQVQREMERHEDALTSATNALKYAPRMRALNLNHAAALDRAGRGKEALEAYEKLARQDIDSVELALNYGRALYADGRKTDAENILIQGVKQWPGSTPLHGALARARMLRGEGEKATSYAEAEIANRPKDITLRLAIADALHRGNQHQRALQVLADAMAIAPKHPALLTAFGVVLDELDRPLDSLKALQHAAELQPGDRAALRIMLSTLIRAGRPEDALTIVRDLRRGDPDEQYLIACEALALRVLGDPAYKTLYDYDRYVRTYDIGAPRGYFTLQDFNTTFADVLRRQHRLGAHPFDQHLQHGTQTSRSLLASQEPVIQSFMNTVDGAVRDYISRLPADASDPMGRRRRERYRYSGLWSVRLMQDGYQPNHVHDRGWISSAYYAAITPNEKLRDPRAGWLKLGEPNRPVANCGPEKFIEPREGMLVLFPSYMWHGTIPFEGGERLSAAFDVTPV